MRLSRLFAILFLLVAIGSTTPIMAQASGGRKREHRNQRGGGGGSLFKKKKSAGHADAFAKGGQKRGFIARIFKKKSNGPWVYRKTNPGVKQNKEQPKLFTRNRTKNKKFRDGILAQQNRKRTKTRTHGNSSFSKKKH